MTTLLSNLSVRLKLAIVAVLMLGITAGLLGFAFLTTQRVERMAEEFAVELTPRAVFALEAAGSAFAASTEEKNAILASNIDSVRRRGEAYRDAMQRALGRMDELRGLIHAEHEGLLQTARTAAADYQAVVQRILTLAETQQDEAATELSLGAAREARLRMSDALRGLADAARQELRSEFAAAQEETRVAQRNLLLAAILGLGLVMLLLFWIGQYQIGRPLAGMTGAMGRLAGGELEVEVVGERRGDERNNFV